MTTVDFREEQRIDMWWVRLAVLIPAAVILSIFVQQIVLGKPYGPHPAPNWLVWLLAAILCVGVPALIWVMRLTVTVSDAGVHIRYYPFVNRTIPFEDIHGFCARSYRPIREFGGWGIRTGLGKKMAYNARGNLGVELYLRDTKSIMIGSQQHQALAAALRKHGIPEQSPH